MYYRKNYNGNVEAATASSVPYAKLNKGGAYTSNFRSSVNKLRSKVIGDAIADTLQDCGLDARFDATSCYLYLDYENTDAGFYITYESSYLYCCAGYAALGYINASTSTASLYKSFSVNNTSTSPFAQTSYLVASAYNFYVTVRGDTAGVFTIYIGSYSTPTSISNIYNSFLKGEDKRDNSKLWGYKMGNLPIATDGIAWVKKSDLTVLLTGSTPADSLTASGEWIVFIEAYMKNCAYITVDNSYLTQSGLTSNTFYEIDGNIYFNQGAFLTKCVTPVSEGE